MGGVESYWALKEGMGTIEFETGFRVWDSKYSYLTIAAADQTFRYRLFDFADSALTKVEPEVAPVV